MARPISAGRGQLVDVGAALAVRIKDGNNHLTAAPRHALVSPDKVHLNKREKARWGEWGGGGGGVRAGWVRCVGRRGGGEAGKYVMDSYGIVENGNLLTLLEIPPPFPTPKQQGRDWGSKWGGGGGGGEA